MMQKIIYLFILFTFISLKINYGQFFFKFQVKIKLPLELFDIVPISVIDI